MRATPPSRRMSAGTRSSAITAHGAGVLGDPRLLGVDDVHDHAALEHHRQPVLTRIVPVSAIAGDSSQAREAFDISAVLRASSSAVARHAATKEAAAFALVQIRRLLARGLHARCTKELHRLVKASSALLESPGTARTAAPPERTASTPASSASCRRGTGS